jgi:perosamine synthetase
MLALHGGSKAVTLEYPPHPVVGDEEFEAVKRVFNRNQFSQFIASAGRNFLGGEEVRAFEEEVALSSGCKYGVAYNSWTSGLHAAVGACGVKFGDLVLCTPYSFTSSASCALMNNCAPVFVDVDPDTCNISAETLERALRKHPEAKVLVLVHLFGLPADMDDIMAICNKRGIKVIEDAAQAPGAEYKGRKIGSMGVCGGFSFTQSKCIMSGEGGVLVTSDPQVVKLAQMIRNHGEVIEEDRTYNAEILGMGYRMTEIAAAIGREQWKKLEEFNDERIWYNTAFQECIKAKCDFITFPTPSYDCKNVYYVAPMFFDAEKAGVSRDQFADAVTAEGVPLFKGYVKPLYLQSLYQNRSHHVLRQRFDVNYQKGICPNAEKLHEKRLFFTMILRPTMIPALFNQVLTAFDKVIDNLKEI